MVIFVGDDWAEDHHDVYLMDDAGGGSRRGGCPKGWPVFGRLHELIAEHAEDPGQVVVGIETDRGLWVEALTAAGYQVFAVNPLAVARYRDRHHVSGAKSDASDAKCWPIWCAPTGTTITGSPATAPRPRRSRCSPGPSDLIWARTRHTNALAQRAARVLPGGTGGLRGLADRDALACWPRPTPADAGV